MAYVAGHSQGATFNPGAGAVTLNIVSHTWTEQVRVLETTHSGSGGMETVIAGVLSGRGNVTANLDAAALPGAASPGIQAGAKGTITFAVGSATPFSVKCLIERVNYSSNVNGVVQFNFDVVLDNTSGTGTYTRAASA